MIAALILALALSSDVREAMPTDRWTPEAVRTVIRAVLKDDRIDPAERELLQTLSQRKPCPPAPAPPAREARLLGLLVTPVDLAVLFPTDEGWLTLVEIASLSPQTEGLIVGFTARQLSEAPAESDRLARANETLPPELRPLGAKVLADALEQIRMERE